MLRRLQRDFNGPNRVTDIECLPGDNHNGGQRVVRIGLKDGKSFAYKPRSIDAERVLFGAGLSSVAGQINGLLETEGFSVRLPILRVTQGSGRYGRDYGYVGWVDSTPLLKPLRRQAAKVPTVRLTKNESHRLWEDAGLLAAFSFAIGLTDLSRGNLVVGRGLDGHIRYHVVDSECISANVARLEGTFLVRDRFRDGLEPHHHVGFEDQLLLCGREGDYWGIVDKPSGWALQRLMRGIPRELSSLVVDSRGCIGYRPYLRDFLSGLLVGFDVIHRHAVPIFRTIDAHMAHSNFRHVHRRTQIYSDHIASRLFLTEAENTTRFNRAEMRQLNKLDVPYFFRKSNGPVSYFDPYPNRTRSAGIRCGTNHRLPATWGTKRLRRGNFSLLLQESLDHVLPLRAPIHIDSGGILLNRPRHSLITRFIGRVGNRTWKVILDYRSGSGEVTLEQTYPHAR